MADQTVLPQWRGFNLLELFSRRGPEDRRSGAFREDDFRWIADWGFDFVRIPMDYRLWAPGDDVYEVREDVLEQIDRVVRLGEQYSLHVSLNFHAAPGYCINGVPEPFDLWQDGDALDAFCSKTLHGSTVILRSCRLAAGYVLGNPSLDGPIFDVVRRV
jgi:endoglucanase